jgi:hypothetical protein
MDGSSGGGNIDRTYTIQPSRIITCKGYSYSSLSSSSLAWSVRCSLKQSQNALTVLSALNQPLALELKPATRTSYLWNIDPVIAPILEHWFEDLEFLRLGVLGSMLL